MASEWAMPEWVKLEAERIYSATPYCHSGHRYVTGLDWIEQIILAAYQRGLADAAGVAAKEREAYAKEAERFYRKKNPTSGLHSDHSSLACKRVHAAILALAPTPAPEPDPLMQPIQVTTPPGTASGGT